MLQQFSHGCFRFLSLVLLIALTSGASILTAAPASGQAFFRLTNDPATDRHPSWTPDGVYIVFESNRFGTFDLFRVPSTGGSAERLTRGADDESFPEVSPQGDLIAFASLTWDVFGPYGNIHVVPITGGRGTQVSTSSHPADHDWHPAWSRDGSTIYFARRNGANFDDWDIMQVSASGGPTTYFMDTPGLLNRPIPAWDGVHLAYETHTGNKIINMFETTFADPSQSRQLTFEEANTGAMGYSPDGTRMVYSSRKDRGWFDLYLLDLVSLESTRLTHDIDTHSWDPNNADAVFSPDGSRIAFTSRRLDGNDNIWILHLEVPPVRTVSVDVDPGRCPNEFLARHKRSLRVAVHGQADFDVLSLNPASVRLQGSIPADRWRVQDLGSPNGLEACACPAGPRDGMDDLALDFPGDELLTALGTPMAGTSIVVELTGLLFDGTPIRGTDCLVIGGGGPEAPAGARETRILSVDDAGARATVAWSIASPGQVFLRVIDITGREVGKVAEEAMEPGEYTRVWPHAEKSPGVYFFVLETQETRDARKLVVVR